MSRRQLLALTLTLVALSAGLSALAQEEPAMPSLDHLFAGGSAALWHADASDLNAALDLASYPVLPRDVLLFGQTATVGFLDGPRVGWTRLDGSASSSCGERTARLSVSWGAGLLEWGSASASGESFAVSLLAGGGLARLTLVDHAPGSFEDALVVPSRAELVRRLYIVEPSIVGYQKAFAGVTIRLRAGFLFTFGGAWKADDTGYDYPMRSFDGPTFEISVMLSLEELLADLLAAPAEETAAPEPNAEREAPAD
jgi:hypothetical protein